jgi:hypothetical protein
MLDRQGRRYALNRPTGMRSTRRGVATRRPADLTRRWYPSSGGPLSGSVARRSAASAVLALANYGVRPEEEAGQPDDTAVARARRSPEPQLLSPRLTFYPLVFCWLSGRRSQAQPNQPAWRQSGPHPNSDRGQRTLRPGAGLEGDLLHTRRLVPADDCIRDRRQCLDRSEPRSRIINQCCNGAGREAIHVGT